MTRINLSAILLVNAFALQLTAQLADGAVCFRKYHDVKKACKSIVSKATGDAEICCNKYGQGYAAEAKRFGHSSKWFECIPCHIDGVYSKSRMHKMSMKKASEKHGLYRKLGKYNRSGHKLHLSELKSNNSIDIWSPWSEWGPCSKTCGNGIHQRTRFCLKDHCEGEDFQERSCENLKPCVIDGGWSEWKPWQACSVTCGNGTQSRTRTCTNPAPQHGGASCEGSETELQDCSVGVCPVDGKWSEWSKWSSCNDTCEGFKERRRQCNNPPPSFGGLPCLGSETEIQSCGHVCSVDGGWSEWTEWSDCSLTCGDGTQTRMRRCDNPKPEHEGKPCEGLELESRPCHDRIHCKVDGNWSEWSRMESCSAKPCSGQVGYKARFRSCTNPRPMFGGKPCQGRSWKRERCYNNDYCTEKVNGGWCEWSSWSDCSYGIIKRGRSCECPPPVNGGS